MLIMVRDQVSLLPSLFAQVGFHGAVAGLFDFNYDSFLDFFFEDKVIGFAPDFMFDRYANHCAQLFGQDAVTVLNMSDLVRDKAPTALESLAKIIPMTAAKIRDALEGPASNIRKSATKNSTK